LQAVNQNQIHKVQKFYHKHE